MDIDITLKTIFSQPHPIEILEEQRGAKG